VTTFKAISAASLFATGNALSAPLFAFLQHLALGRMHIAEGFLPFLGRLLVAGCPCRFPADRECASMASKSPVSIPKLKLLLGAGRPPSPSCSPP